MRRIKDREFARTALILSLGLIGGWVISATVRAVAPHRRRRASKTGISDRATVIGDTWSTMAGDVAGLFAFDLSPVDQVHRDYLSSYASLTSSLAVVIGKMQHDGDPALSALKLGLLDQRISLSESVFD